MFYDNISYFVGSANAKLANDMKQMNKINKLNKNSSQQEQTTTNESIIKKASDSIRSSISNKFNIDFELVKISCKKECDPNKRVDFLSSLAKKIINFIKFKWIFRIALFIIILAIMSFTIFRLVEHLLSKRRQAELERYRNLYFIKRDLSIYDSRYLNEWSGEKIPTIYEIDFDSLNQNSDQIILNKFDFIKKVLKIKCILIRNANITIDLNENSGRLAILKNLITQAQNKSLKVLIDIDLSGTLVNSKLFKNKFTRDLYLTSKNASTNHVSIALLI
jgi:hypothetical protein